VDIAWRSVLLIDLIISLYNYVNSAAAYCEHEWWERVQMPDWAVALLAALGGSLIGVLAGFLLYKCCCKS
jgi:uncharacterized integral membrane protein